MIVSPRAISVVQTQCRLSHRACGPIADNINGCMLEAKDAIALPCHGYMLAVQRLERHVKVRRGVAQAKRMEKSPGLPAEHPHWAWRGSCCLSTCAY